MFLKILFNKLVGYVRISVEGFFIERFINICKLKNILLWGMKRENTSILHTNISISDFKEVKEVCKKTKCRVHIESKRGVPFCLNRYRKRKFFAIGFIAIFFTIICLSRFIWNIEIQGLDKINKEELVEQLKNDGLKVGSLKKNVNKNEIINSLRLERNDISWIGIEIKGTNAVIKIVESDQKPKVVESNEYCNIVSDKNAVIQKVNAENGTAVVNEGDIVRKGDILVGGWMEGKYTGVRYEHAMGEITAKVWHSNTQRIEYKTTSEVRTGNSEKKYKIKMGNFEINLFKTLSKFEKYDTMYQDKRVKIFSDFYLPLEFVEYNNYELMQKEENYSVDEAKAMAINKAEEELNKEVTSLENITNKTVNVNQQESFIEVEVVYEVLENIGTEEKIVF